MIGLTGFVQAADQSKEWPTYGHDSGGMRFSPLTELTPENVARLKVAWVYHMRPAGFVAPEGGRGGRPGAYTPMNDNPQPAQPDRGRAGAPVGDTPETPQVGRGRGGRGGSGFRPSSVTPLVINGTMYLSTPYSRVVAIDPATGKELWAF